MRTLIAILFVFLMSVPVKAGEICGIPYKVAVAANTIFIHMFDGRVLDYNYNINSPKPILQKKNCIISEGREIKRITVHWTVSGDDKNLGVGYER